MSFDPNEKIELGGAQGTTNLPANMTEEQKAEVVEEKENFDSLTEPVCTTIGRDFKMIWTKLTYVMIPRKVVNERAHALRDWDLWGPLFLCLVLSFTLSYTADTDNGGLVFEIIFVVVWAGAAIVAVNG